MAKNSNLSFRIAYCGIVVALSVVVMYAALIPAMTYVLPAISGICIWTIKEQINRKWGLLAYVACSLLSFILVPEIEANMYLIMFFGYYPLVSDLLEKIKPTFLSYLSKFAVFDIAVVIAFNVVCLIINIDQVLEGLEGFGDMAVYVLWGAANVAFICYDVCLGAIMFAFKKWLKPKFNKRIK